MLDPVKIVPEPVKKNGSGIILISVYDMFSLGILSKLSMIIYNFSFYKVFHFVKVIFIITFNKYVRYTFFTRSFKKKA